MMRDRFFQARPPAAIDPRISQLLPLMTQTLKQLDNILARSDISSDDSRLYQKLPTSTYWFGFISSPFACGTRPSGINPIVFHNTVHGI